MSVGAVVGNLLAWSLRGAVGGFAIDLGRSLLVKKLEPRNTLICAVHGLAIGIIGSTLGTGAAVGAFLASTIVAIPALLFENLPTQQDGGVLVGLNIRLVATLVGAAVGSIF